MLAKGLILSAALSILFAACALTRFVTGTHPTITEGPDGGVGISIQLETRDSSID